MNDANVEVEGFMQRCVYRDNSPLLMFSDLLVRFVETDQMSAV